MARKIWQVLKDILLNFLNYLYVLCEEIVLLAVFFLLMNSLAYNNNSNAEKKENNGANKPDSDDGAISPN